jgi:hypothetical protein
MYPPAAGVLPSSRALGVDLVQDPDGVFCRAVTSVDHVAVDAVGVNGWRRDGSCPTRAVWGRRPRRRGAVHRGQRPGQPRDQLRHQSIGGSTVSPPSIPHNDLRLINGRGRSHRLLSHGVPRLWSLNRPLRPRAGCGMWLQEGRNSSAIPCTVDVAVWRCGADAASAIDRLVAVDSTIVRARRQTNRRRRPAVGPGRGRDCPGLSRHSPATSRPLCWIRHGSQPTTARTRRWECERDVWR